jgi:hypothetical protein
MEGATTMEENSVGSTPIRESWNDSVNRLGRLTLAIAMFTSFTPVVYLVVFKGVSLNFSLILKAMVNVFIAYASLYVIEPVAFYPSIGNSGSYMGWLIGSVANTRLPASVVAKNVIGVKDNTQESEIVSTAAIAGSVIVTIVVLTVGVALGMKIIEALPDVVMKTLNSYIIPVIFGAVTAMLGGSKPLILVPAFIVLAILNYLSFTKIFVTPSWVILLVAVVGTIVYTRILYKQKKI